MKLDLIVHINQEAWPNVIFTHGSEIHTDIMKTQALKQALSIINLMRLLEVREETKKARQREVFRSKTRTMYGTQRTNDQNYGICITER